MYGESADGFSQPGEGRPLQPDQHREGAAHAQNTPGGLPTQVPITSYSIHVNSDRTETETHLNNTSFPVHVRFAYHLRQWQIEGTGISSHLKALSDKQSLPLRIVCQPAGLPDKVTASHLTQQTTNFH